MSGWSGWREGAIAACLAAHGDRPALLGTVDDACGAGESLTFAELAAAVRARAADFGGGRRLVVLRAANRLRPVVDLYAALDAGHAVVLAGSGPGSRVDELVQTYRPDLVVEPDGSVTGDPAEAPRHRLHESLALLLSTSGSTGSPKLVRLSHENLLSNARAIAEYLALTPDDRAITTLPLQYCYGLSVLNSHLVAGASVVLNEAPVTDDAFWCAVRSHDVTNFAGVPYTFEQLEHTGFAARELPSLRFVTQAGGRLAPERVRRFAALGRERGWELFVMYGQTEATARMAYLPPALAAAHPDAIGVPIPGGAFRLEPAGDDGPAGVGELVYSGPNVMLGYATSSADLARGREVDELHTGDLARCDAGGLYTIVGRCNRVAKIFGLRIDLDEVERIAGDLGADAACAGDEHGVYVCVAPGSDVRLLRDRLAARLGVPRRCVRVVDTGVPRLAAGKPDYAAIRDACADSANTPGDVRGIFAAVLQVDRVDDDDTFVGLGGDSLSYVEVATRLEALIGPLPRDWHERRVGDLRAGSARRADTATIETGIVLRAVAIVLVVGTHVGLFRLLGGAHVLLAVAGFNFARFQLHAASRLGPRLRSAARVAAPSAAVIAFTAALGAPYGLSNVLLLHGIVGDDAWTEQWRYWFVEVLVQILLVLGVVLAVGPVRRLEQARPFWFAAGLLAGALAVRELLGPSTVHAIYRPHTVVWVFALGWAAQRAGSVLQRLAVSAVAVAAVPGVFGEASRDAVLLAGVLLLVWVPALRVPRAVPAVVATVAAASLHIYLTHPHVYPHVVDRSSPFWGLIASVAVGVAVRELAARAAPLVASAVTLPRDLVRSGAWPAWQSSRESTGGSTAARSRISSVSSAPGVSSPT